MTPLSEWKSLTLLLYALTVGAALGVSWDVFRIIRIAAYGRKKRPKRLFIRLPAEENEVKKIFRIGSSQKQSFLSSACVFLSDLAFCIFAAVCMILLIFRLNDGEFRGFALFGALLGFVIYYFTVGRLTIIFSDAIIKIIKKTIIFVFSVTLLPIAVLFSRLFKAIGAARALRARKKLTDKYIENASQNADNAFGISYSMASRKIISMRKKGRYIRQNKK